MSNSSATAGALDLTQPARPPPPGVDPSNVPSRKSLILGVSITFPLLSASFVILRLYARFVVSRAFGLDDALILFTMAAAVAFSSIAIACTSYGLGLHLWHITKGMLVNYVRLSTVNIIMIAVLPYLIKISIMVMYLRIFGHNRTFRRTVYGSIAFMVAAAIAFFLPMAMQCIPLSSAWDFGPGGRRRCINGPLLGFITVAANAVTDLYVMCLPLPLLWRLQMPLQRKIGVIATFATGGIATTVAFVRVGVTSNYETANADATWTYAQWMIWSLIELNVGIITSCMPPLQPLLRKVTGSVLGSVRTPSRRSNPANRSSQYMPKKYGRSNGDTDFTQLSEVGAVELRSVDRGEGVVGVVDEEKASTGVPASRLEWPRDGRWDENRRHDGIMHTIDVEVSSTSIQRGVEDLESGRQTRL